MQKTLPQSVLDREAGRSACLLPISIVADDLTGACDTAAAFAQYGIASRVALSEGGDVAVPVAAVCTETRDAALSTVHLLLDEAIACWNGEGTFFKKVDSVFRGNTFLEIAYVAQRIDADVVLIAPAFPALGRICRDGILHVQNNAEISQIDLKKRLLEVGVEVDVLSCDAAQFPTQLPSSKRTFLADATTQSDLEQLARHFLQMDARVCWVGSAGLAHALASCMERKKCKHALTWKQGKLVFCIGSDHKVTSTQVEYLRIMYPEATVFNIPRFADSVKDTWEEMQQIPAAAVSCVLMTGGDTALAVCRALNAASLEMQGEVSDGIPYGTMQGGAFDGKSVVLKSGGFGPPDLFIQLMRLVEGHTSEGT